MCIFRVQQLLIMHRLHYVLQLNTYAWLRGLPEKPISDNFKVDETKFVAAQGLAQCQIETLAISDQFAQTRMAAAMQQDQEVAGGLQVQVESSF